MLLTSTHLSPYSSLDGRELPRVHWWDAASRQHGKLNSCAMSSAPTSNAKEGSKDQAHWGNEKHSSVPSLVTQWPGKGLERELSSGTRQEGGDNVSKQECSSGKQGGKRRGVGQSSCSELGQRGEERQKPMAVVLSVSVQLRHPEPALVLPFLRPKGNTYTWKQDLGSSLSHLQDLALSTG